MFGRKKQREQKSYDKEKEKPVIRASICTGEQVAGFKDLRSGKFTEIMLIWGQEDLKLFAETYGINESEISKEY